MAGLILARAMNIKFPAHDEIISWQTLSRKEVQRPLDWNASVKLSRIAMKFNLTVAFIAALSFVTDTLAEKTLPPGAGPDASVPANILLSIDNSSSMNTNVSGPRVPTDPKDIAIPAISSCISKSCPSISLKVIFKKPGILHCPLILKLISASTNFSINKFSNF